MSQAGKLVRCAVYTRKSSEEGLDQSFNSLDAQREACEAYVLSQKHEGWQALSSRYDDGGFSGGNMERPGLKKLLTDIAAKKIDTVVVYKVDRLTRSLADFAKIVESFDGQGVSFVSVTQQFNTTSSMGRLTLNVLLSFAQFEREVTGERIRDKVAASKRKGMWMGGQVPLGYDLGDRELLVNEQEAEQVREIFRQYLRLGCVRKLQEHLQAAGVRSKRRTTINGRTLGGCVLSRGTLYHLLSSPLYLGKIVHRGKVHDGLHPAIVSQELWDKAAAQLTAGRVRRKHGRNLPSERLLTGLLFNEAGERYTPTHAAKKGRRYFYYTCQKRKNQLGRLPAMLIERLVLDRLQKFMGDAVGLREHFSQANVAELRLLIAAAQHAAERLEQRDTLSVREWVQSVVKQVTVCERDVSIELRAAALQEKLLDNGKHIESVAAPILLEAPIETKPRGRGVRLVLGGEPSPGTPKATVLLKAVARARDWADRIVNGEITSLDQLVAESKLSRRYAKRILQCAALSPAVVQTIVAGAQPPDLSLWELVSGISLAWNEQIVRGGVLP